MEDESSHNPRIQVDKNMNGSIVFKTKKRGKLREHKSDQEETQGVNIVYKFRLMKLRELT